MTIDLNGVFQLCRRAVPTSKRTISACVTETESEAPLVCPTFLEVQSQRKLYLPVCSEPDSPFDGLPQQTKRCARS